MSDDDQPNPDTPNGEVRVRRGSITAPWFKPTFPKERLVMSRDELRVGSNTFGWHTVTRDSNDPVELWWSRPWRFERVNGLRINDVLFSPARLQATLRDLDALGWSYVTTPTSHRRHVIGIAAMVAAILLVGLVAMVVAAP